VHLLVNEKYIDSTMHGATIKVNNIDIQEDGCFVFCSLTLRQKYQTGYLRVLGSKIVNQHSQSSISIGE